VAENLDLVEIASAEPVSPAVCEDLPAERKRLAWLTRWGARARVGLVVIGVLALGTLLVADHPGGVRPSLVHTVGGECPPGVPCQEHGRASQNMWASFSALFVDARATDSRVWLDPTTGVVYSQVLTARQADVMMRLTQVRSGVAGSAASELPAEFDVPLQWQRTLVPRTVIISCDRGAWVLTATLRGPWGARLPLDAARRWVVTAPLPE
jgi:hypothetical protein